MLVNESKRLVIVHLLILLALASSACTLDVPQPTPYPDEVPWYIAVEILNRGEVEAVYQLHNLEVTLVLKDGLEVKTIEPGIDDIFDEIQRCGQLCAGIMMATE